MRYRPCHHQELAPFVHLVQQHCGGMYGFVSSHAANFMGIAIYVIVALNPNAWIKFMVVFWGLIIGYSRVYLGVHYPFDVLAGCLLGMSIGVLVARNMVYFFLKPEN